MKKVVLSLVLFCAVLIAFSQNDKAEKIQFGFGLGTNYAWLSPTDVVFPEYKQKQENVGFTSSLVMDYQFSERFRFSPKIEVAMHQTEVVDTKNGNIHEVFPASLDAMCHLCYDITQGTNCWYFLLGPGSRFQLNQPKSTNQGFGTNPDVFLDFGVGLKHQYSLFSVSPELRYSMGLANVNGNPTIPAFSFNKVSLICYFK